MPTTYTTPTLFDALDTRKALEVAIDALDAVGSEHARRAALTLRGIYTQKGCEHLGEGVDTLPEYIDIIMFG